MGLEYSFFLHANNHVYHHHKPKGRKAKDEKRRKEEEEEEYGLRLIMNEEKTSQLCTEKAMGN